MAKKKKKNSKSLPKNRTSRLSTILNYVVLILGVVAVILSILVLGYYFGYKEANIENSTPIPNNIKKEVSINQKKEIQQPIEKKLKEVLKKDETKHISASHEIDNKKPPKSIKRTIKKHSSKPKLAIIIDDVSTKSHVNSIKNLQIPLTMSFLPPSAARPHSAELASKEKFYMVHLPMEAQNFTAEEPLTLRVKHSQYKISSRIEKLKKLFPRVKYINNHTGSKFTSNEVAMNKLIYSLNKNNIYFIDSRTTAETKVPKVMKNFGFKYVARDIFLDHKHEKEYILKQIQKAVKIAKKHGSAIAIGHPHANTLWALNKSKKYFKDIDLVLIDKLN